MTRKDYILLSDALRAHFEDWKTVFPEREIAQKVCLAIGEALKEDNPSFDMKLWLKGCGL